MERVETHLTSTQSSTSPRVVVVVCTFRRNEPLRRLLQALRRNQDQLGQRATLGVVVVDDNPDGRARSVADEFEDAFLLGLHYRTSGQGNISIARNIGLEAALPLADWIALTDDDCEPVDDWVDTYLARQQDLDADIVTGPCLLSGTEDAPSWLTEQPFLDDAQFRFDDGATLATAATNNSFVRAELLRDRPDLRFDPALGVVGGEDMVFFRTVGRLGASISFAADAVVHGHEPPERWTFRYQLRSRFWLGNTEFVTNRRLGEAGRIRWFARGCLTSARAVATAFRRLLERRPPQWRYAVAQAARGAGMVAGAVGVEVRHH